MNQISHKDRQCQWQGYLVELGWSMETRIGINYVIAMASTNLGQSLNKVKNNLEDVTRAKFGRSVLKHDGRKVLQTKYRSPSYPDPLILKQN